MKRTSDEIAELARHEHVVCWLYSESTVRQEDILLKEIYFLTSRKKIYLYLNWPGLFNVLQPVELSFIEDVEFRERVAAELANIPDPQ